LKIEFKDGTNWIIKVVEISELQHFISWELLETSVPIGVSSVINKIKLYRITDYNSTFMTWETDFSNDVDISVIEDNKYKKLEYFNEMKKVFNTGGFLPTSHQTDTTYPMSKSEMVTLPTRPGESTEFQ